MKRGLFLATFLLIIPSVSAQFYYGYLSGPIGVLGGFNFANIYSNYAVYIDAIIFLLIFLGLGKLVFGLKEGREREEPGYKLLYIGLALLMTVSLLLLESRMGFTLLDLFGPWVSFVLLLILTYASYAIISEFIKNKWIVFGLTLISFLFFLDSFYIYFGVLNFLGEFIRSLFDSGNHRLLYLLALILLLIGIFRSWKGKETEGGAEQGVQPSGPITPEREPPRARELPTEVIATLQEKDRVIAQSQEQINALAGAIEALNKKVQGAIEAGRADFAEKMAAQARGYAERIARIKNRRNERLMKVAGFFNQKLKELETKIEEQKRTYEALVNEASVAKAKGDQGTAGDLVRQAGEVLGGIESGEKVVVAVREAKERVEKEDIYKFGAQYLEKPEFTYVEGMEEPKREWRLPEGIVERGLPLAREESKLLPAVVVESEKLIREGGLPIRIEPGVMRQRPPLLLPPPKERRTPEIIESGQVIELPGPKEEFTEQEIDEALAAETREVEKIKYYTKKINIVEILNEVAKKRDLFEQIERETFLLKLFTKKAMPQRNVLTAKFLYNLQENLAKLERAASLYLRFYSGGRYAPYILKFREGYKKELMNFIEVQKYKDVRKEVRLIVNRITKLYPWVGEIVKKRLNKPTDITIEISNYIANDDNLNQKEKDYLLTTVDTLDKHISVYSRVLSDFFNELKKCRDAADEILKLR